LEKFSLDNKNVVITGASSGIGRQCAIECSRAGANLIMIARNEERLEETKRILIGDKHLTYSQDITEFEKIMDTINDAVEKIGKIDGFIHSAGIELTKPFSLTKPEDYEKIYRVNVISGFEIAKIISSKKYINESGGSLVFLSSVMGENGAAGKIAYCASKGAMIAGIKAMALELVQKKIRVNCVSPAVVETDLSKTFIEKLPKDSIDEMMKMHPLGLGKPEDVANACIYLLSDEAKWVTGSNLVIDGGYSAK